MPAKKSSMGEGVGTLLEQVVSRVLNPLGLVVLSRERIRQTLDEAAERGRLTRSDAEDLALELIHRGRLQTEELLRDVDRLVGLGRATRRARRSEPVDRLVAGADRARRTIRVGSAFPISGYEDLTAPQVKRRLGGLKPAELRAVRAYERRHAGRKSVLSAIDRALR